MTSSKPSGANFRPSWQPCLELRLCEAHCPEGQGPLPARYLLELSSVSGLVRTHCEGEWTFLEPSLSLLRSRVSEVLRQTSGVTCRAGAWSHISVLDTPYPGPPNRTGL